MGTSDQQFVRGAFGTSQLEQCSGGEGCPSDHGVARPIEVRHVPLDDVNVVELQDPGGTTEKPSSPTRSIEQYEAAIRHRQSQGNPREPHPRAHIEDRAVTPGVPDSRKE
jgi:hypothetical protein